MNKSVQRRDELPDVADVPVSGFRVLVAGLAVAGGVMVVGELFMVLILRRPELLLIGAPLTVAFLLTVGAIVAGALGRVTRRMRLRSAALVFFAVGLVVGGLWGYPVFILAMQTMAESGSTDPNRAAALVGAVYVGSTAGLGALAGRYFAPWVSTRPQLVRSIGGGVLGLAVIGFSILSFIDLGTVG